MIRHPQQDESDSGSGPKWFNSPVNFHKGTLAEIRAHIPAFERRGFGLTPESPSTGSGQAQNPMRVHFRLVDAAEGEHGNVKAAEGKDRVFILAAGESGRDFIAEENGEPEQDNLVLDEWFTKQGYSAKDSEFNLIYVNGGNNLENLKTPDDLWKVRLIEEDFHRLMFEAEGV